MAKLDIFPRSLCIQAIIFLCVFSYYTIITEHCISHTVYQVIGQSVGIRVKRLDCFYMVSVVFWQCVQI